MGCDNDEDGPRVRQPWSYGIECVVRLYLARVWRPVRLLPGLRPLRTPLATGYLWILLLRMLLGGKDHIRTVAPTSGPVKGLFDLGTILGATVRIGLTFTAFILGSLQRRRLRQDAQIGLACWAAPDSSNRSLKTSIRASSSNDDSSSGVANIL